MGFLSNVPHTGTIEVVRGRLTDTRAGQLLRFWATEGLLGEEEARRRLPEVVCVLVDRDDEIQGVNSAFAADVDVVGGRRLWVYRSFLRPSVAPAADAMVAEAYRALRDELAAGGPLGLCVLTPDRLDGARPPAVTRDPPLVYAGRLPDGRLVRVAWFPARSGEGSSPAFGERPRAAPDGYEVVERDGIDPAAIIDLWTREDALPIEEARRRVEEVLVAAVDRSGSPVGVHTMFLQRNARLGMDLWHARMFVASAARHTDLGLRMALAARDLLRDRFTSGRDARAPGIVYEIENESLKRSFGHVVWERVDFRFIGENERGDHVRVHFFPGAVVPPPRAAG